MRRFSKFSGKSAGLGILTKIVPLFAYFNVIFRALSARDSMMMSGNKFHPSTPCIRIDSYTRNTTNSIYVMFRIWCWLPITLEAACSETSWGQTYRLLVAKLRNWLFGISNRFIPTSRSIKRIFSAETSLEQHPTSGCASGSKVNIDV